MLRTCIGLALGAALAVGLCLARGPPRPPTARLVPRCRCRSNWKKGSGQCGLKSSLLAIVEQQVDDGELPSDLVNTAFLWARRKPQYRVQYFEKALQQLTNRAG